MTKQKNTTIETLRGLAIVLVVIGHVIGSTPEGGMKIDFPSPWRYLYSWIDYIQMPLFTAIAGWVYFLKPSGDQNIMRFIYDKFRRLIIPMLAVGASYYVIQYLVPGTNNKEQLSDIWRLLVFPYTVFWYLQSLFLIFVMVLVAQSILNLKKTKNWIILLIGSYMLYIAQVAFIPDSVPNIFSFKGALEQLPYFVIGMTIQHFGIKMKIPKTLLFLGAITGIALLQARWFHLIPNMTIYRVLLPLWLFAVLVLLLRGRFSMRAFVFLGTYTYSIYLFHCFGTAGGRIMLSWAGVNNELIVFSLASLLAIFAPIIADKILSKNKYTAAIFLGKK